jgi:hypothetical protein
MSETINDSIRRTMAYWYRDGLAELCMGVVLFLLGVVLVIEGPAPHGSRLALVMASLRYLVILGGTFSIGVALRYFKGHLIYPRTGYVIYHKPSFKEMAPGFIAVIVLVYLLAGWVDIGMPQKLSIFIWLLAGLTAFFGYLFLSWGWETEFRRFYLLGALVIFAGAVIAAAGILFSLRENIHYMLIGPGLFFLFTGAVSCLSGAFALRNYLVETRARTINGEPA